MNLENERFIETTLGQVASPKKKSIISGPFGSNIGKRFFQSSGIPVIRGNNLTIGKEKFIDAGFVFLTKEKAEELNCYAKEHDIVFTAVGTLGQVGIIEKSLEYDLYVISNKQLRVTLDTSKIVPLYAYYWFSAPWTTKLILQRNVGSTVPLINLSVLRGLPIRLPKNILEQHKIVEILENLGKKIELNNRINQELEGMAKLLYDYWFVQFDFPISEEQASSMGKPVLKGKPYKSSGGAMVYNEQLKREIPEGWGVQTLKEWIKKDKSGDWGKEHEEGNYDLKVSCIRGADLNGINGTGDLKCPTRYILEKNSHKLLEPYDLIVEISGGSPTQSTGRMAFITEETLARFEAPLICSNFCKAITLKNKKHLFYFTQLWKFIYNNNILFGWEGKTSGIKNLLFDSFVSNYYSVVPPEELISSFYDFMKPNHAKIQINLKENQQLSDLRDWLLPMLMNGQVRVSEGAEKEYRNKGEVLMAAEGREGYNNLPANTSK